MTRYSRQILAVSFGFLLGLVFVELGLRVCGISFPAFVAADPVTAFAHRPGVQGWHNGENRVFIKLNSQGFNDVEHEQKKADGVYRIAILGDSMAEGFDVPREKTFASLIESELASCGGLQNKKVETFNFGIGGFGTAQELLLLQDRVWQYDPDMVVLSMFAGNDVRNNHRALQRETLYPYFVEKEGQLVLDASFLDSPEYRRRQSKIWKGLQTASDYSRFLQLVNETKKALKVIRMKREEATVNNLVAGEHGLDYKVFAAPTEPAWLEAWSVTEKLLAKMNQVVTGHGAKFLVVGLGAGVQVTPDQAMRDEAMKRLGVDDLFYVERRLAAFSAGEGFAYLPLAPVMASQALVQNVHFHGGKLNETGLGHWNERGHEVGSKIMAKQICEMQGSSRDVAFLR